MKNQQDLTDKESKEAATAVEEATKGQAKVATENKPKPLGQREHVVIVWNDDEHTEVFVMAVLMKVCHMNKEQAYEATMKIHNEGMAPVWRGLLEVCEFKRDQIATFRDPYMIENGGPNIPLNVTIAES